MTGWWCGGIAGSYDICNRHDLRWTMAHLYEKTIGREMTDE